MEHDWLNTLAGWAVAAIGLGGTGLAVRAKMSRDSTQRTKDRAESEFVSMLLKERDEARDEARKAHEQARLATEAINAAGRKDAELVARLRARCDFQEEEIRRLMRDQDTFKRRMARLYPETREYVETNFSELAPLAPRTKEKP